MRWKLVISQKSYAISDISDFFKKIFKVTGKSNFYCLIYLIFMIQILENSAFTFKLIISISIFNCKIGFFFELSKKKIQIWDVTNCKTFLRNHKFSSFFFWEIKNWNRIFQRSLIANYLTIYLYEYPLRPWDPRKLHRVKKENSLEVSHVRLWKIFFQS